MNCICYRIFSPLFIYRFGLCALVPVNVLLLLLLGTVSIWLLSLLCQFKLTSFRSLSSAALACCHCTPLVCYSPSADPLRTTGNHPSAHPSAASGGVWPLSFPFVVFHFARKQKSQEQQSNCRCCVSISWCWRLQRM